MPVHISGNHWCLAVANIKSKTYKFYDPLQLKNADTYMDRFVDFIHKRNSFVSFEIIDATNWKSVHTGENIPRQKDSCSCGVFVIFCALLEMKAIDTETFNPCFFRGLIARRILQQCPNMRHLCLICGKDEYSLRGDEAFSTMIQCSACYRWLHVRCCSPPRPNADGVFKCFLCSYYLLINGSQD